MSVCRFRALLCGVFSAAIAGASTNRDTIDLPSAHVEGQKIESKTASVTRLDAKTLRRFASLEDAVNTLPGFRVRRQGGLGGYSELSFRGADAGAVEIYLDGLRLNQAGEEAPDLAKLPLLWFTSVESRSGFEAGEPGSLARLDLSTAGADSNRAELQTRIGSFSTAEGAATVHGGADWKWTVGVEGQTARNDYPFFADNRTIYNTSDDAVLRMDNNAYWSRGARAALRHDGVSTNNSLSLLWLDYRKEYPGIPNTFASNAQAYTRRTDWMGSWRILGYPGRWNWAAGLQVKHFDDAYHDPGLSLNNLDYQESRAATAFDADARTKIPLTERLEFSFETRLSHEDVKPTSTPFTQAISHPSATRDEAQLGGSLLEKLTRDLSLVAEARGTRVLFRAENVQDFPADTPHVLTHHLKPLALRGGATWRTFVGAFEGLVRYEEREPSSLELLGDNNGIRPNLNLNVQKARTFSALHELKRQSFQFQTRVFWHRYENPIRLEPYGSSSFLRYANGSAYRAMGFEEDIRIEVRNFESRASFTAQSLRILEGTASGHWPAYQSPIEAHVDAFWKPQTFLAPVSVGPLLDFLGPYYPGDLNFPDARRSPEWELGAHLGAQRRHAELAFDARNLFDRNYRDFAYSIRSGRSYSLSLSIHI